VITNRKPCRRRRYEGGRAGKKINQPKSTREIASATPPGRHVDVDVDVASLRFGWSRYPRSPFASRSIDRSSFSFPRIKTHEPTSAVRVARWHVSRVNLSPRYIRLDSRCVTARTSAVVEREISDVRYLDSSFALSTVE